MPLMKNNTKTPVVTEETAETVAPYRPTDIASRLEALEADMEALKAWQKESKWR